MAVYELNLKELRTLYTAFPFVFRDEGFEEGDVVIAAATRADIGDVTKPCIFGKVFLSV